MFLSTTKLFLTKQYLKSIISLNDYRKSRKE